MWKKGIIMYSYLCFKKIITTEFKQHQSQMHLTLKSLSTRIVLTSFNTEANAGPAACLILWPSSAREIYIRSISEAINKLSLAV